MPARPTLLTPRLRLRPPDAGDADRIERLAGDRRIADTVESIPHPFPPGVALRWIEERARVWAERRSLALAITLRAEDALIGVVSLDLHDDPGEAELGYWVTVPDWNRGYATEAARAILAWGFGERGLDRVWARCLVRNPASARVMTKLGLRRRERLAAGTVKWGRPEDVDVYVLAARDFVDGAAAP